MSTSVAQGQRRGRGGRRIALLVVAAVAVAVIAAVVVWAFPVFKVSTIEVTGNERVSEEAVWELTGVPEGENLLRVDTVAAASGVVSDPWVSAATVTRQLPSTLKVELQERTVVAYRDGDDGPVLIDSEGTPFIVAPPPEGAVLVAGDAADDERVLSGAVDIAAAIPAEVREQVAALEAESPRSYTFVLHDGRRVHWGASTDNANKALAMETVLLREGSEWDVSNPELVTVR